MGEGLDPSHAVAVSGTTLNGIKSPCEISVCVRTNPQPHRLFQQCVISRNPIVFLLHWAPGIECSPKSQGCPTTCSSCAKPHEPFKWLRNACHRPHLCFKVLNLMRPSQRVFTQTDPSSEPIASCCKNNSIVLVLLHIKGNFM